MATERPMQISAAELAKDWATWEKRIQAGECEVIYPGVHLFKVVRADETSIGTVSLLDVKGSYRITMHDHDLEVRWLTPSEGGEAEYQYTGTQADWEGEEGAKRKAEYLSRLSFSSRGDVHFLMMIIHERDAELATLRSQIAEAQAEAFWWYQGVKISLEFIEAKEYDSVWGELVSRLNSRRPPAARTATGKESGGE